uniref:Uncharacterized protein n=1 Tax=Avena sativa TaxID=4498 RepID=A0ACD5Z0B6_AVESA
MTSKTASSSVADEAETKLSPSGFPVKEVPGGYGVPFFSPLKDRLDYYYLQGAEEYFRSRIGRNGGATVLRVNMPPGPFITRDSGVVALLDARSFAVLLDDAKVDKTDTLDGTFMPSLKLFGGYRPLAFLDAADPRHAAIKGVVIRLAVARMHQVAPTFDVSFGAMFDAVDASIDSGPVQFNKLNQHHMFDFTCCALTKAVKWLLLQLHPIASKVIKPWRLEDLLLHTFCLPAFLVRRDYAALTAFFAEAAAAVLDDAEKAQTGISRDELLHNLVFVAIFNAYGGFKIFLPHVVKWLARAGPALHARLAEEVRAAVPNGSEITVSAVDKMPLVKSVVWEALRMNPPVEFQYGRARQDSGPGRRKPRHGLPGAQGRDAVRVPAHGDARRARVQGRRRVRPRKVHRRQRAGARERAMVERAGGRGGGGGEQAVPREGHGGGGGEADGGAAVPALRHVRRRREGAAAGADCHVHVAHQGLVVQGMSIG